MRLDGRVAIVTGASSGIGKAIAEKFVSEGAKVVFSDLKPEENFKESDYCFFQDCDVSEAENLDQLVNKAVEKYGKLDIMVNNAGIGETLDIINTSNESWNKVIGINLSGVFYGTRAAARYMKDAKVKGSIINMSSILGKVGMAGAAAYCAAKGGVVQLTRASAIDLAPLGIRVNAIGPGFIKTNMTSEILENEQFNQMIIANT
ncbi:MAG: SDR family oxidoreductase, partial [Bacteriovoracaceae bacterium]